MIRHEEVESILYNCVQYLCMMLYCISDIEYCTSDSADDVASFEDCNTMNKIAKIGLHNDSLSVSA